MKKLVYLMSIVALLLCYSCNSSENGGGNKEKMLSLCEQGVAIFEEGVDRMRAADSRDEFLRICDWCDRRIDKWEEKAENSVDDDEVEILCVSDDEIAKIVDELKVAQAEFWKVKSEKELEFDIY